MSRPSSVVRLALVGALGTLAAPALADDVYLHNGSVFEDVVAEVTDTHVIVELAIGRLRFPAEQVREVVRSESLLQQFHEQRQDLLRDPASEPASWVELASWARARGLERSWKETALFAARLDPGATGLEPLMLELGYERDDALGWVPRAEAMRRRGLVEYRGSWVEPERAAELHRADREASAEAARAAEAVRSRRDGDREPSDNEVALASIELARDVVRSGGVGAGRHGALIPGYPAFLPGWPIAIGGVAPATPEACAAWEALAVRQPGSIIPLRTFRDQLDP